MNTFVIYVKLVQIKIQYFICKLYIKSGLKNRIERATIYSRTHQKGYKNFLKIYIRWLSYKNAQNERMIKENNKENTRRIAELADQFGIPQHTMRTYLSNKTGFEV